MLKWLALLLLLAPVAASAVECSVTSGARRVPLLELYTSEGCDSCPPTDKWLNGLPARGLASDRVVTLAFHVDYWNHLGWTDPYARAEFSQRQRGGARRSQARFVYTPQLVLNGKDYRRGMLRDDLTDRVTAINRETSQASISLTLKTDAGRPIGASGEAVVQKTSASRDAPAWLALYENRLASQVAAGENRGRRLEHDFVVRELAGPFMADARGVVRLVHQFHLDPGWKRGDLGVAAFLQDERSGDVLQALALPLCGP